MQGSINYSMLLSNSELADGTAIFDASRNNAGTAILAAASLDVGMAAIGNQIASDEQDDPVHQNMQAKYLTVPPSLYGTAKRLVRDLATGDGDLIVRSESRLGTAGVVDPQSDTVIEGSATRWYLSCPSDQAVGVVVGGLYGRLEPRIRHYRLEDGEFGVGFDVSLPLAVAVLNPKALYYSSGTE